MESREEDRIVEHSPSFLGSAFSVAILLRAEVRVLPLVLLAEAVCLLELFFFDDEEVLGGFSLSESMMALDCSGECEVRKRLESLTL